ncbi:MAG: hypothetical protein D6754_09335 [Alphaproteobacteria bacterium]|nr:MAG: hypothetical protein D6754_09335 [Alphaproteobacteria bacterium]
MSSDDFLVWRNIAYQADAHLMEKGAMLPAETRLILARIRDVSERMGRQAQRDWAEATDAPATAGGSPTPGLPWRRLIVCARAAVLLMALGLVLSPVTPAQLGPVPPARMAGLGRPASLPVRLHIHGFLPLRMPQMLAQDTAKLNALPRLPLPVMLPQDPSRPGRPIWLRPLPQLPPDLPMGEGHLPAPF